MSVSDPYRQPCRSPPFQRFRVDTNIAGKMKWRAGEAAGSGASGGCETTVGNALWGQVVFAGRMCTNLNRYRYLKVESADPFPPGFRQTDGRHGCHSKAVMEVTA